MIDLNNQNWVEGFVKESADLGLSADETKQLLAHAAHIEMYKSSEAYKEGFDKEAQGARGYFSNLWKAIKGSKPAKTTTTTTGGAAKSTTKPLKQQGQQVVPPASGKSSLKVKQPMKLKPQGATLGGKQKREGSIPASSLDAAKKKVKASPASVNKAKDTAAKARGEKGTTSQKSTAKKDTAGETAAAGAEQSKGFFGNAGSRLGNLARYGVGAGALYGGLEAKDYLEDLGKGSDELALQGIMESNADEQTKLLQMQHYLKNKAKRDYESGKSIYGFGSDSKGKTHYRPKDYWAGSGN